MGDLLAVPSAAISQRNLLCFGDDNVIEQWNFKQFSGVFQTFRDIPIGFACIRAPGRMVVGDNET